MYLVLVWLNAYFLNARSRKFQFYPKSSLHGYKVYIEGLFCIRMKPFEPQISKYLLRTNRDIFMKLSADLLYDVIVKWWWLYGHCTNSRIATPTLPRTVLLSNTLQEPQQKIKFFKNSFCIFSSEARSFKKIYETFFHLR